MGTIQIRNLDEETIRTWKVRAAQHGQSLQEYMRAYVTAEASKPTVEEIVASMNERSRARQSAGTAVDLDPEVTVQGIDEGWK
jgi:plasmid stability protein